MRLVLFDFDGTITRADTMLAFARIAGGEKKYRKALTKIAWPSILLKMGIGDGHPLKERFLGLTIAGLSREEIDASAQNFTTEFLPKVIFEEASKALAKHQRRKDKICVVTASCDAWVKPWTDAMGFDLIASKLAFDANDVCTGKLVGKNVNGREKVTAIKQFYNLKDFDKVVAYGNSSGDKPMLELADESHYRAFNY